MGAFVHRRILARPDCDRVSPERKFRRKADAKRFEQAPLERAFHNVTKATKLIHDALISADEPCAVRIKKKVQITSVG